MQTIQILALGKCKESYFGMRAGNTKSGCPGFVSYR